VSQTNPQTQSEETHTVEGASLPSSHGVSVAATGLAASNEPRIGDQHLQEKAIPDTLHTYGKTSHVDPSHWVSILEDIKEVRESLSAVDPFSLLEPPRDDGTSEHPDLSLALGSEHGLQIKDILVSLPTRPICDMLVSRYFNARYMVLGSLLSNYPPLYIWLILGQCRYCALGKVSG
jgi:hypothetical protein